MGAFRLPFLMGSGSGCTLQSFAPARKSLTAKGFPLPSGSPSAIKSLLNT